MTKEELRKVIEEPTLADEEQLLEFLDLSRQYPYCAPLQSLILLLMHKVDDLRFPSELHERALVIPDLRLLFTRLNSPLTLSHNSGNKEKECKESSFDLIDNFLEQHPEDSSDIEELLATPPSAISTNPIAESIAKNEPTEEIISNFLKLGKDGEKLAVEIEENELKDREDNTKAMEDTLLTETLARLYIKQGKYERAERTLTQINLEFPKKSGYFAEQLSFLKKLIKNSEYKLGKEA